jgi:2-polyprenyl-3-methyl-5-hydroxy-6-metoxy-1,4-benzoquinol methylase
LLPDKWKSMLRGPRAGSSLPGGVAKPGPSGRALFASKSSSQATILERPSRGLEEFFKYFRDTSGLTILDLGIATQQNVTFITNLGHRLYAADFLQTLSDTFGLDDTVDQSNPGQIEYFLKQSLDYPEGHFDAVLIWDVLEYLAPAMLTAVVERLHRIVRPKGYMLAFFHADNKLEAVPFYTFRIQQLDTLQVAQQGERRPAQLFNNRSLEKLFGKFESVKFFLTRDRLREVIVKA